MAAESAPGGTGPPHDHEQESVPIEPSIAQDLAKVGLGINSEVKEINAPFSPAKSPPVLETPAHLPALDLASMRAAEPTNSPTLHTPITGLRLQTDHLIQKNKQDVRSLTSGPIAESPQSTIFNAGLPVRHSSIRSSISLRNHRTESPSPGSTVSSPGFGPLVDMTPLPSPLTAWGSPHLWRRSTDEDVDDMPIPTSGRTSFESTRGPGDVNRVPSRKRKVPFIPRVGNEPQAFISRSVPGSIHKKERSISEYIPDAVPIAQSRNIVVSSTMAPPISHQISPPGDPLHREEFLAEKRGLAPVKPPTPPDSDRGRESYDSERPQIPQVPSAVEPPKFTATTVRSGKQMTWYGLRQLGKGQFSAVMLATSTTLDSSLAQQDSDQLEKSLDQKSLVAVKVCIHGPAGGADEKSLETSIKRELDLMKKAKHPSLVHLKASTSVLDRETLFVLNYCPGGDLFELASQNLTILTPPLIRRIFAELVSAVRYLHQQYIVHRDIKLENILVNLRQEHIRTFPNWQTFPHSVITLSDLGLGRELPQPPESPLLTRRCGSEDYAAPEVLIGQEYDGRLTDAWALGVVLYALMEGRMPFDPVPGSRRKSPTSHRIARCEWQWVKLADDEGEWDPVKGKALDGAHQIVEGLLVRTRSRWSLEKVQETNWVAGGIQVAGGLVADCDDEDD